MCPEPHGSAVHCSMAAALASSSCRRVSLIGSTSEPPGDAPVRSAPRAARPGSNGGARGRSSGSARRRSAASSRRSGRVRGRCSGSARASSRSRSSSPKRSSEPGDHGRPEALLGPVRAPSPGRGAATARRRTTLPAPPASLWRDRQPVDEVDERRGEERDTRLDAVRHREAVDAHQQQLGQPHLELVLLGVERERLARPSQPRPRRRRAPTRAAPAPPRSCAPLMPRQPDRAVHRQRAAGGEPLELLGGSRCRRGPARPASPAAAARAGAVMRPLSGQHPHRLRVAGVAPEQLVRALAGEHDLHALARGRARRRSAAACRRGRRAARPDGGPAPGRKPSASARR